MIIVKTGDGKELTTTPWNRYTAGITPANKVPDLTTVTPHSLEPAAKLVQSPWMVEPSSDINPVMSSTDTINYITQLEKKIEELEETIEDLDPQEE